MDDTFFKRWVRTKTGFGISSAPKRQWKILQNGKDLILTFLLPYSSILNSNLESVFTVKKLFHTFVPSATVPLLIALKYS